MAFVSRSEREFKPNLLSATNIGPGEYSNTESIEEARALHRKSNIYTHRSKLTTLEINIPFNSTDERKSMLFQTNNNPGPGSYINISQENKMKNKLPVLSNKDEIIFVKENEDLVPKIKREKQGFLSSEKRFFEKVNIKDMNYTCKNTERDNYEFNCKYNMKHKINEKMHNNRYFKNNSNFNISNKTSLDNTNISIPTIPDKNRGDFKLINGNLEEVKKISNSYKKDKYEIGPGQYDISPKWKPKAINWNYGCNNESKNILYKNKIISYLKESQKLDKNNLSVKLNNRKILKSISKEILNTDNTQNINHKKNNSMRNQVFNRHIKDRKRILTKEMNRQKRYNELINDIKYKDTPGPGFYNNKIHPVSIFNTNQKQNFGSDTPKFYKIGKENVGLGPGSYFLEKNKFQPKIEVSVHIKNPDKKNIINDTGGLYEENNRMKNRYRYPVVGQYNLSKNFIKDEISNVNSFGLSERFKNKIPNLSKYDNYDEYIDEQINRQLYQKINFIYDDNMMNKLNQRFLEMKKDEEMLKKKRRDKFMNKKSPGVGDYSPEYTTSLSYNVLSKINKYRNNIAPFNIKNTRFSKNNHIFIEKDIPGPGDYNVANAFTALNNGIKNGYINNNNANNNRSFLKEKNLVKIKNNDEQTTPGPGMYDQNVNDSWNKKSFNVLFMDK